MIFPLQARHGVKLRQKPHVLRGELPPVQVLQSAAVRLEVKPQLVGVQRLIGEAGLLVHGVFAVLAVPGQGVGVVVRLLSLLTGGALL